MDDSREMIAEATRLLAEATTLLKIVEKRTRPVPDVRDLPPADGDKLENLFDIARDKVFNAGGSWVKWNDLRPAYRERAVYEERMWVKATEDSSLETEEELHGTHRRRRVRVRT